MDSTWKDIKFATRELKWFLVWCLISNPIIIWGIKYAGLSDIAVEVLMITADLIGIYVIVSYYENIPYKGELNEDNCNRQEGMHEVQQDGNDIGRQRTSDQSGISRKRRKKKHRWRGSESDGRDALSDIHTEQPDSGELQGSKPDVGNAGTDSRNTSAS